MPATPTRRVLTVGAVVASTALVVGLAVVSQGYDAQELPRLETSVWVTRDDGQYARVNTDLAELDTVRSVQDPTSVVQSGSGSVVFSQGYSQVWPVDSANPTDLTEGARAADGAGQPVTSSPSPAGTRAVASAGDYLLYLTDTGSVFLGTVDASGAPIPLDPFARDDEPATYAATAVAVTPGGQVALYSAGEASVRRYDATTRSFVGGPVAVPSPPKAESALELALVGTTWVLSAPAEGLVWVQGRPEPVETGLGGDTRLQSSSDTGAAAYLADSTGLLGVDLATGEATGVATANGVAAAPLALGGVVYAAWLTADTGTFWSSETEETAALETQPDVLDEVQAITPVFRSNGQRAVLNETSSGMVWTVPDGTLIPVDQWTVGDDTQRGHRARLIVDDVAEEKPPVAVADSFGVRSGAQVALPLLLNDHDPNKKDVLSDLGRFALGGGLSDPAFGSLGLASNNQQAVVTVGAPDAGSATFSYAVTDGAATSDAGRPSRSPSCRTGRTQLPCGVGWRTASRSVALAAGVAGRHRDGPRAHRLGGSRGRPFRALGCTARRTAQTPCR